jgi:hypothetical protein
VSLRTDPRHELFERHGLWLPENAVFLGTDKGAVAFTNYDGETVELHMAGERGWVSKTLLKSVWAYVWGVLDCTRCTAKVREDRLGSLRINLRLGFKVEGYMRQADQGLGVWILGMLKEESRYGLSEAAEGQCAGPDAVDPDAGAVQPGQHVEPVRIAAV